MQDSLNTTLLIIAEHPVTVLEAFAVGLIAVLLALLFVGAALMRATRARTEEAMLAAEREREMELRFAELARAQAESAGRLSAMSEGLVARQGELARLVGERLDGVTHRLGQSLDTATRATHDSLSKLGERLAVIDNAQANIASLAGEVVSLKDILANKQARGAFGQGRMETIIADALPPSAYEFQATLSNGKRPDCIIRVPGTSEVLTIDAKFPLEAVTAWREGANEADRKAAGQRLRGDIARHAGDIADKYLIPGETQDIALMFVPSESIYADLHESFDDAVQKAYRARVILVSPSFLMLAIEVVQQIMRDARMREQANAIQAEVGHLTADIGRLRDRVVNLQRHFGQANEDVTQILTSADKISRRGARIEAMEFEGEAQPAERLPNPTVIRRDLLAGE